jgi:hypothetical protein
LKCGGRVAAELIAVAVPGLVVEGRAVVMLIKYLLLLQVLRKLFVVVFVLVIAKVIARTDQMVSLLDYSNVLAQVGLVVLMVATVVKHTVQLLAGGALVMATIVVNHNTILDV